MEPSKIRNFSIIAHIDHGKSTLADRMLEVSKQHEFRDKKKESRILDRLGLEQERGITIKLQAVRMLWNDHQLNLIDTPGHVDFSYEVSRSLAACEAAILLVDAVQGVQAQTISTARKALDLGLTLIPVLNKVDMDGINLETRYKEIESLFGFKPNEVIQTSGKTGFGVPELLDAVITRCPAPVSDTEGPLRSLIFDSFYDEHKGVVVATRVFQGQIDPSKRANPNGELKLHILQKGEVFAPTEVGIFSPDLQPTNLLRTGEVGYIATGLKDIRYFTVGDTISTHPDTEPLPGYKTPKPNVFATFFPSDPDNYEELRTGLNKLSLNDAALTFSDQKSTLLGSGFRCGFLGLLHMEIVQERLEREYDVDLIITAPTVEYHITKTDGTDTEIHTPDEMPEMTEIEEIREPWVRVNIFCPQSYMGSIMDLCQSRRGSYVDTTFITETESAEELNLQYITIKYDMPLGSLISNFFDEMKSLSSGYASMEYEYIDHFPVDLVKVSVLVNKQEIPALNFLETREAARGRAAKLLEVMKDEIPRQQFQVPLQAAVGAKIIAREDIRGFRKDVTSKLYGGDYSRKKKLLEKQKKGKKRLRQVGKVNIPQSAFLAILKT